MNCSSQASLSITNCQSLPKPMSIESVMPSNHLILCYPLLLLASIFPSIRVFSNESALCIRWPKYWSCSFSISPSNEYPGLISWMDWLDWLDLLAFQGTLKSLLQHHSSKASTLWHSAFFTVQLSHPYDHWKTYSLDQMDLCWQSNVSAFEYAIRELGTINYTWIQERILNKRIAQSPQKRTSSDFSNLPFFRSQGHNLLHMAYI